MDDSCLLRQAVYPGRQITVEELLLQNIASIGENIVIRRFVRWELGENAQRNSKMQRANQTVGLFLHSVRQ